MSTVYDYILTTGVIVPDAAIIQTDVQNEYIEAFGSALDVTSPSTPQGLLINAETQARIAVASNNATLANQINPNLAGGVFLDAILALMGSQRTAATSSIVFCTLTGVSGTIIPAGSLAQDVNGNQWQSINSTTIPLSGMITNITFEAVNTGPIVVNANQITQIISNVLGWETITNPNPNSGANGSVGQSTQTDVSARQYRINTLYLQSNGLAGSIIAALTATDTVSSLYFIENPNSSTQVIQDVSMNANSIYCCINGTNNQAIAAALTATKSAGCAYTNGASRTPVTYAYTVPISGQVIDVLWDYPDIITIGVQITVLLNTPVQDYIDTITNAIINYANGQVNGIPGLTVGANVSPFEISAAVVAQYPGIFVTNCLISNVTEITQIGTVTSGMNTVTGLAETSSLWAGMVVSDGGVNIPAQTTIATIVNSSEITLSNNATGGATETITFHKLYQTGTLTMSSKTVTGLTNAQELLYVGMQVSDGGVDIPVNTVIATINSNTQITLNNAATGGATELITFSGVYQSSQINIAPWQQASITAPNILVTLA